MRLILKLTLAARTTFGHDERVTGPLCSKSCLDNDVAYKNILFLRIYSFFCLLLYKQALMVMFHESIYTKLIA